MCKRGYLLKYSFLMVPFGKDTKINSSIKQQMVKVFIKYSFRYRSKEKKLIDDYFEEVNDINEKSFFYDAR